MLRRTAAKEKEQAQEDLRVKIAHACCERTKNRQTPGSFFELWEMFPRESSKSPQIFCSKMGMNPVCSSKTNKKGYLPLTVHFKGVHIIYMGSSKSE